MCPPPNEVSEVSAPRVVSLLPSATEMVCAVGMGQHLVGVSHECDYPASVIGRPVLTSSRLSVERGSGEIDRDLRRVLKDALAVYDVDAEALQRAAPDVIITQDLCEVCAVAYDDVLEAAKGLTHPELRMVNLHPRVLEDIRQDLLRVGEALGRADAAAETVAGMDERIEAVRRRAEEALADDASPSASGATGARRPAGGRPKVLTIEWIDPVMIGGMWMPELVSLAGGQALVTTPGEYAPTLDAEQLAALDPAPDVVLVKPCGFPLEKTLTEGKELAKLLRGMPWPAVEQGAVWVADGNAYFNRPGPRMVDSLEVLAACVHPELFGDFASRYAGGFQRFDLGC